MKWQNVILFLQAFTTEVEETTTPLPLIETNLKFEDDLLTINMGALLAEVSDDSVNFPADVLQEKTEEEEIEEMPEREEEEEEEKNVEELKSEQESHLPVTEFFILDPADKTTSFESFQSSSPFFLLNRRNVEKKQKVEKEEEEVVEGGKSLKTRVVYINNQRLELPPDSR